MDMFYIIFYIKVGFKGVYISWTCFIVNIFGVVQIHCTLRIIFLTVFYYLAPLGI